MCDWPCGHQMYWPFTGSSRSASKSVFGWVPSIFYLIPPPTAQKQHLILFMEILLVLPILISLSLCPFALLLCRPTPFAPPLPMHPPHILISWVQVPPLSVLLHHLQGCWLKISVQSLWQTTISYHVTLLPKSRLRGQKELGGRIWWS